MSTEESIIFGVIAGVITSFVLLLFKTILEKIILPWYKEFIYKGVDIEGNWHNEYIETDTKSKFSLIIIQNAHDIKGTLIFTQTTTDNEKIVSFQINGKLWEGFLSINLMPDDRKKLSFANSLLKVTKGGSELNGYFTFRNIDTDEVISNKIQLTRD